MKENNNFSALNQQIILLAVQAVQEEDANLLKQLGLSDINETTASRLKNLRIEHLNEAGNYRGSFFDVLFQGRQLNLCLDYVERKTNEDQQINRAIKAGLRQNMLQELKGISRREYTARRERLGLADHPKGRFENLDEVDELLVLSTWIKLAPINDPLERLLKLHDQTSISLDRAWIAIKQSA